MRLYRIDKIVHKALQQPFWMPWGFRKWLFRSLFFLLLLLLYLLLFTLPFEKKEPEPIIHEGDVEVFLKWSTADDLDLHCMGPDGVIIYYQNKTSPSGGKLDVDMNVGGGTDGTLSIEHIYWPVGGAPDGEYKVWVNLYSSHSSYGKSDYTVTVKVNDTEQSYSGSIQGAGNTNEVCTFTVSQ